MSWRTFTDVVSVLLFCGVLVAGLVFIIGDEDITSPTTTTTAEKHAVDGTPAVTNTTTVKSKPAGKPGTTTTTTQVQGEKPGRPAESTVTTTEGERTTFERVLGDGGMIVVQLAAVVLAAFLAAAVAQRVLLGEYGGLKLGALELGAIARASTAGLDELKQAVQKLREDAATAEDVNKAQEESRREDAAVNRDLALLLRRIDLIERRMDDA